MKIAFLIQDPGLGGLASMHDRLEEALESDGHTVDQCIVQQESVIEQARDGDYDVVHLFFSPFLTPKFFLKLLWFNQWSDATVLVNYYNIKPENLFRRLMKRVWLPLLCDTVVLPSENMEQFYRETIGISNTATVRPIVADRFFEIGSTGEWVVHFGHAREDKGLDRLAKIATEETPIHCSFIQDDAVVLEQFPKIREAVDENRMILHDMLPEDLLEKARVAVFPYYGLEKTVDLPLAVLESHAASVHVMTSDIEPLNSYLPDECLVSGWEDVSINEKSYDPQDIVKRMNVDAKSVVSHYCDIIHAHNLS